LFVLVCLLFRVGPWKRYVGPVLLYVAIMTAWGTFDYFKSPVRFSAFGMPQSQVQRNFADVYYGRSFGAVNGWRPVATDPSNPRPVQDSGLADGAPATIRPQDGPASQRLYQLVAVVVAGNSASGKWNADNEEAAYQLYGRYGSTEDLVGVIFARPNPNYYQLITQAAAAGGGDQLLGEVAREHGNAGVFAYLNYLVRHPTLLLKGPPNSYVGYHFFSKFYRYGGFMESEIYGARDLFVRTTGTKLIAPSNGPASQAFERSIRFFLAAYPQFVGIGPGDMQELGGTEGLIKFVLDHPYSEKYSGSVMGWVFQWLCMLYGEEQAGSLMGGAALETTLRQQLATPLLVGDFLSATVFAGDGTYGSMKGYFGLIQVLRAFPDAFAAVREAEEALLAGAVRSARLNSLPPSMSKHVGNLSARSSFATSINASLALLYGSFKLMKPFLFLLMITSAIPLILASRGRILVLFLVLTFFVSSAAWVVAMIMPGSDPRHEDVYAFIPLLIASLGIASFKDFWRIARHTAERVSAHRHLKSAEMA
jgi:hypothetical protein